MLPSCNCRLGHYCLLLVVAGLLILPNLGRPSLWDIDEGNNAEAAREMLESGNWVVPTFNFQLRVDKPALLYWLQIGAYRTFGVNEFAARLPSALAALLTVILVYELGRVMFGSATGLISGVIIASAGGFCASAHFANPDALLHGCTVLTLLIFWRGYAGGGRLWFAPAGAAAGLAALAKGPIGIVLPFGVVILFLLWSRQLRILWDRRITWAALGCGFVALPWYIWVTADTKAEFLRGFLGTHNLGRFLNPMESHRGPAYYYLAVLLIGFAPWSIFIGTTAWYATGKRARNDLVVAASQTRPDAYRFLWCWVVLYFVFFSAAATKLPNYILPIYTPLAVLTARFLDRWRCRQIAPASWTLAVSLSSLLIMGFATTVGILVAGGAIDVPRLHGRQLAGISHWAVLGALPVLGAAAATWSLRKQMRTGMIAAIALAGVLLVGTMAGYANASFNALKAPRYLVQVSGAQDTTREIRVGCYQYFQPSLVFYCRREVQRLSSEQQAMNFLRTPLPVYLFVPATDWQALEQRITTSHRVLARHMDLYQGCEIIVVTNQP